MLYSILFQIKVENDVQQLQKLLKTNLIFLFCNNVVDEYVFEGPLENEQDIEEFFSGSSYRIHNAEGKGCYIYVDCENTEKEHLIAAKSCVYQNRGIMMSTYQINDNQYYSVVIFGKEYLENFLSDLKKHFTHIILSQKEIPRLDFETDNPYVKMKRILNDLTELQLGVLRTAIEQGYYENPRKIHMQDIAKNLEKSRSTIEKLFRTAENKIMDIVIPELYSYLQQIDVESGSK